ncbi:unnamed protein product [Blepharisma stoltei]|uniref:Uncharacterized protein n=1 Tax=Blepharisma stoltei TaxID=1481888 RepID=A0AAU9K3R3_9CILI|nr:unnamed protein product [Blepharisma stoltei]
MKPTITKGLYKSLRELPPNELVMNLIEISKQHKAVMGGGIRESILKSFEDLINENKLKNLDFARLANIPKLCDRIELYNVQFYMIIANEIQNKLHQCNDKVFYYLSDIAYYYTNFKHFMNPSFYRSLENHALSLIDKAALNNIISVSVNLNKNIELSDDWIAAFEKNYISKHQTVGVKDLGLIGTFLTSCPSVGKNEKFNEAFLGDVRTLKDNLWMINIAQVVGGIGKKGIKCDELIEDLHKKAIEMIPKSQPTVVKEVGRAFEAFDRQLEVPFYTHVRHAHQKTESNTIKRNIRFLEEQYDYGAYSSGSEDR